MDPVRILVVEDEAELGRVMIEALHECGFLAEHVGTAEEARDRLAAGTYEVVLVDNLLPGRCSGKRRWLDRSGPRGGTGSGRRGGPGSRGRRDACRCDGGTEAGPRRWWRLAGSGRWRWAHKKRACDVPNHLAS